MRRAGGDGAGGGISANGWLTEVVVLEPVPITCDGLVMVLVRLVTAVVVVGITCNGCLTEVVVLEPAPLVWGVLLGQLWNNLVEI